MCANQSESHSTRRPTLAFFIFQWHKRERCMRALNEASWRFSSFAGCAAGDTVKDAQRSQGAPRAEGITLLIEDAAY